MCVSLQVAKSPKPPKPQKPPASKENHLIFQPEFFHSKISNRTTMFTFTLLTPSDSNSAFRASLLNFDNELHILADPGWNGENPDDVLFMEKYLKDVELILLSHSTPEYIGGYILLCTKFPSLMSTIPVYATVAVSQLGRVATVEFYRTKGHLGPLESAFMEVNDVDEWFDKITLIKYFQNMSTLENRILLTAYNSGHSLGGSFWLITKRLERIVYAPTWNHSKDSFLNSASFLSPTTGNPISALVRPSAIITGTDLGSTMSHKKRTEKFLQLVDATLANGGAVLLPTSISGRFLELLHIIDDHLADLQGAAIPVYFLSYSGTKVLSYASNLLDWMSSLLIKEYEGIAAEDRAYSRVPFEPSKVDLLLDARELVQLPGPKIVFASGLNFMDGDLSSQALQLLCQDEKTTIILTEKSPFSTKETISSNLFDEWYTLASQKNNGVAEDGIPVPLERSFSLSSWTREEPLNNQELASFKDRTAHLRKQKLMAKVRDKKNKNILNADLNSDDSSSSDDEVSSEEEQIEETIKTEVNAPSVAVTQTNTTTSLTSHEVFLTDYVMERLEANQPVDIRVTHKLRPRQAMFPFVVGKKRKFDDYGEVINANDFQKSDENSANNKLISESKRKFELSDKGGWGESDGMDDDRRGRNGKDRNHNSNKLTPQEVLNNQVLQKYLDTLFKPVKRIPLGAASALLRNVELKMRCGLSFVDLSGLVDLRSMNMIISVLRPYNLVLLPDFTYNPMYLDSLNGLKQVEAAFSKQKIEKMNDVSQDALASTGKFDLMLHSRRGIAKNLFTEMGVFVANGNQTLQIGSDGHGRLSDFEVKLDEEFNKSLVWQSLGANYKVSQIHGELEIFDGNGAASGSVDALVNSGTQFVLKPSSKPITKVSSDPQSSSGQSQLVDFGSTIAIGNIRLPELKKKLISKDLNAEFKGEGTLVVNNAIAIKKISTDNLQGEDTGDIIIDGQVGPLYYQVKKCIRELLAYV